MVWFVYQSCVNVNSIIWMARLGPHGQPIEYMNIDQVGTRFDQAKNQ